MFCDREVMSRLAAVYGDFAINLTCKTTPFNDFVKPSAGSQAHHFGLECKTPFATLTDDPKKKNKRDVSGMTSSMKRRKSLESILKSVKETLKTS